MHIFSSQFHDDGRNHLGITTWFFSREALRSAIGKALHELQRERLYVIGGEDFQTRFPVSFFERANSTLNDFCFFWMVFDRYQYEMNYKIYCSYTRISKQQAQTPKLSFFLQLPDAMKMCIQHHPGVSVDLPFFQWIRAYISSCLQGKKSIFKGQNASKTPNKKTKKALNFLEGHFFGVFPWYSLNPKVLFPIFP